MRDQGKKTYHILYSRIEDQQRIRTLLESKLEGTDSEIFIPFMEYYKRGEKAVKIKPIFPSYLFIYSAADTMALHKVIRDVISEIRVGVRELGFKEQYSGENAEAFFCPNVTPEEEKFLDFLRQGNGILTMSVGYKDDTGYHVVEGPLKAYEDEITDVDAHNRKAFLSFEIDGRSAQAGFECKPKEYFMKKR